MEKKKLEKKAGLEYKETNRVWEEGPWSFQSILNGWKNPTVIWVSSIVLYPLLSRHMIAAWLCVWSVTWVIPTRCTSMEDDLRGGDILVGLWHNFALKKRRMRQCGSVRSQHNCNCLHQKEVLHLCLVAHFARSLWIADFFLSLFHESVTCPFFFFVTLLHSVWKATNSL